MTQRIIDIANRFLEEKDCTAEELSEFKAWLTRPASQTEVNDWLANHWALSAEIDSSTLIETVSRQIQEYQESHFQAKRFSLTGIVKVYQKFAAFLLIPLIGLGIFYWVNQNNKAAGQFVETIAPRGQKSQIVLSDGTKIWLNSDTRIKYPGRFSSDERDVYLEGEAFFEVTKNKHRPFIVHTSGVKVKVLGTKFNVKAYSDEDQIETSLFEGKINLMMNNPVQVGEAEKSISPGQSYVYSKVDHKLEENRFPQDEINGWKHNQLIFKDDTFGNLVKKVERWYDVKMVYDEKLFNDRRLTVELVEGERLERLMDIISLTLSVNFRYDKGTIILTPKGRNM